MFLLITGVSGSGKTTLQNELIKNHGWIKPINFTTRKPRNDLEKDEYVFLRKDQFATKLINGDFLEISTYGGNFYGIANIAFDATKHYAIIIDPIGRSQVVKKFELEGIPYHTIYLHIDKDTQIERLTKRGDSEMEIAKRASDFKWFEPLRKSTIIDGTSTITSMVSRINQILF